MDTSTLAILAIILRRRKRKVRSRYAKRYYLNLDDDGRRKRDRRIPRIALVEPKMSNPETPFLHNFGSLPCEL